MNLEMKFKRIDDLYDYLDERHMVVLDKEEYEELKRSANCGNMRI